jgi:type I restriction enzyme R subunit
MMRPHRMFTETVVESATLAWLESFHFRPGPTITGGPDAEREGYDEVVLGRRLREVLGRLNPQLPEEAHEEAFRKLTRCDAPTLIERNRAIHRMIVEGVEVEYRRADGSIAGARVQVIDFDTPDNNHWLCVNQLVVVEGQHRRRPDVILFLNGLPVAVIELKNAAAPQATIWAAYEQLQVYQAELPSLFAYNAVLVIADGPQARIGVLGAGREWFRVWRTISGHRDDVAESTSELQTVLQGVFHRRRFLDLLRYFLVFEDAGGGSPVKKMAGYHQFHAVNFAVQETLRAAQRPGDAAAAWAAEADGRYEAGKRPGGAPGDRRVGVVWHTQGSGKSLTMAFYAGRLILHPEMANPTLVVLTDRNDLDDQLFGTFARCRDLLRQPPVQAANRADLRAKLEVAGGGVVFTTIQKFLPEDRGDRHPVLSARQNVVVIADEAHRSQYDFLDGYARHLRDALPNASFIGFTGTPIETTDANTRAVFGDYISVYDIYRAVQDGATVPIYYENRSARLALDQSRRPRIDPDFEEVTEGEEVERKEKLKSKWAQLEAIVGAEARLRLIARDLVAHFEERLTALDGKAMVVCMSRRICVDLYREIAALRPAWVDPDDERGALKVVMTGSASDPVDWQPHIRTKGRREDLATRFRTPGDPFRMVIVRDMWLTGFDAPSLHTMYLDKPMHGHGLMQAIARVNRVFEDKPGGRVVDYLGLTEELRKAVQTYSESGGNGEVAPDQEEAVAKLLAAWEVCRGLFAGFRWSAWTAGTPAERVSLLPKAQEHILAQPDGKARLLSAVRDLSRAFALAVPHEEALRLRDDISFFQAVRAHLIKSAPGEGRSDEEHDHAIRQIVSRAVVADEVVDLFAAAGLKRPDVSILSDEFLADVRAMPERNLAVELLRKLLTGEIRTRAQHNVVQARSFAELLEQAVRRYQNRAVEAAQVIEELIALAREMRQAASRGEALGLTADELAFYDALETNDSAVQVLGEPTLKTIARELVETVRNNVTIDWTVRENVRAQLRVLVKRTLRKHGYPPDKQEQATRTVLQQAELLSEQWAG